MKIHSTRTIIAGLSLLISSAAMAQTQVDITTLDGDGADVYVENNKANFGDKALVVKNAARGVDDPHVTRKVYIRFDVSELSDRLDDIEDVRLSLMTQTNHLGGSATPPRAYTVMVDGLTDEGLDNWVENEVLWNDAPANILTNNELDPDKTVDLGLLEVPEIADPDLVTFSSSALVDFIKADTNGVITLILRRQDSDAGNNLAFHSKETAEGATLDNILPTLRVTIGGELLPMNFAEVIEGTDLGGGILGSSWFGRVERYEGEFYFTHLGWVWGGTELFSDNIWLLNFTMDTWMWTSKTVYPWVYTVSDGWIFVHQSPENETFLYYYDKDEWTAHDDFGWVYPMSEQELMDQLMINIPAATHPRILLTAEDIPELREKMTQGWMAEAYEQLKWDTELILREPIAAEPYGPSLGRRIHDPIIRLAFVGYMEESQRHFDYAIDFALHQLDTYTLDELRLNNAGSPHLGTGDVLHAYGIAFDWLYPYMNIIERSRIRNFLNELGTIQYEDVTSLWNGTDKVADATNHNSVAHGGLGMAALALGNKPEWVEQAISQNRRYLQFSTDATGWNFEGRGYFLYGGWGAFPFCEAINKLGGPDVLSEYPKYENVAVDFFLRQMPPYDYGKGIDAISYFVARSKDPVGHWMWLRFEGDGPEGDSSYGREGVDHGIYTLLVSDPDLETRHPRDADLPLDKLFENGRATFRDSWEEDAAVMTYSTGWTVHTGHRMRSENSFNFYALEEEFSISPEDAQTRIASLHSMVMVDERRNSRDAGENSYGSVVEEYRSEAEYGYIRGDAKDSAAYFIDAKGWQNPTEQKVSEATRQILFVRSPEGLREPYLVIVDDLTTRADSSKFSWLLQTPADNTVEFGDMNDGDFTVTGFVRGAMLDVDFIAPENLTNEMVTHTGFVENKGRWDENEIAAYQQTPAAVYNGKSVRFITLLRAHEPDTSPPSYTFTGTDTDGQITVQLSDGTTDLITIKEMDMTFERTPL